MHKFRSLVAATSALLPCFLVSGCAIFQQLSQVGEAPPITPIQNPTQQPDYKPVSMPMPLPQHATHTSNSLWQPGARGFFKDQRAAKIGDILTVNIDIDDNATTSNETKRNRDTTEKTDVTALARWTGNMAKSMLSPAGSLFDLTSKPDEKGKGGITRTETISLKIAAVITQILPNGNLVISGRQEVLINFERRDLMIQGIIRPEDISNDNTIPYEKIAEARIYYGGQGQITNFQQPAWGSQIIDIINPF